MLWTLPTCLMTGLVGIFIFVYYMRRGQFDDPEDVKYQMFRDDFAEKGEEKDD